MTPLLYVSRPKNVKTGPIPTAYVGESFEEAKASCTGCPLLGGGCYAWLAMLRAFGSVLKAYRTNPEAYSLESALVDRHPQARFVRFTALGDPARSDRGALWSAFRRIRREGLGILGYTHFWRKRRNQGLRQNLLASCNTLDEVSQASNMGWIASAIIPADYPDKTIQNKDGLNGFVCPAQWRETTCNDCGLCDPQHAVWDHMDFVAFKAHGSQTRRLPTVAA